MTQSTPVTPRNWTPSEAEVAAAREVLLPFLVMKPYPEQDEIVRKALTAALRAVTPAE